MLLERDDYLDELDALLERAMAGEGHVAFVAGEAGIGKTSLLHAFAERARLRVRVVSAACEDLSAPEALSLLRDLSIVDQDALADAGRDQSRLHFFAAVLQDLSREPTVLLLEDIHWADDASLDFIRYVGRRLADVPLLVVASARNDESEARQRLHRAATDIPKTTRTLIELPRLSSKAVGRMAASYGLIGHAIHDATGGNPLFVSEMLSSKGGRPALIDEIVVSKAAALSEAARALLDLCSIYPRRTPYSVILEAQVEDAALDECLASGMLVDSEAGLAFRHELIRQAVERALPPMRRLRFHVAALKQLEASGASAARCLHHALAAGDTAKVTALAPVAAEQASALGSHRAAAQAWGSMLAIDGLDPEREVAARERYAFELHMFGAMGDAIAQLRLAQRMHASNGNLLNSGDCQRFLSRLHYLDGNRSAAEIEGQAAVQCLEPLGESSELALAYANLAHLAMLAEDSATAIGWSEKAERLAAKFGRTDILATVYNNWGTAIQFMDADRATEMVERSIALGIETGSQEHVARAYTNLGWLKLQALELDAADEALQRGISYCLDNELGVWRDYMAGTRSLALVQMGRWSEAEEISREIAERDDNTLLMRNPAVRALALVGIRRGAADVSAHIEELREHMDRGREFPRFGPYAAIVAERAWTTGAGAPAAVALVDEAIAMIGLDHNAQLKSELLYWREKLKNGATKSERAAARVWTPEMPFEKALALSEGDEEQAREALDLLGKLGAVATEARLRNELVERGLRIGARGPRASTRENPYQLTKRELQILECLDQGLTNKQIGDKLFVSAKTVDHHVTSILGKLAAGTRGEAAAKARAEGILPSDR